MSKETKSFKVTSDFKVKLENLFSESGLETQEAFLEHIATLYEMHRLKDGLASGYQKQLDELEYHSKRNFELFVSMIETEAAKHTELTQQHDEKLNSRYETIMTQEDEINNLQKERDVLIEKSQQLSKDNETLAKQIDQLNEISKKDNLLVEEYRAKLDTLTGLVNEYKESANENHTLKQRLSESNDLLKDEIKKNEDIRNEVKSVQIKFDKYVTDIKAKMKNDQDILTEKKDLEKERELLKLRTEHQEKLSKINDEATLKIRELYEQIEKIRQDHDSEIAKIISDKNIKL